ncbi:hypothetical protein FOMG_19066 [Fusarium oxysporum f. sp. melonis 26406]|uniref:Choline dehydrogenase n=1 Tax=Fusarium oxysporum f. sp. melonis 26406 TaxID=1089452 RepID=W9ZSX4_FUSOX|nr:choline dehydrogenase [Fusarium oxysporum f. sp. melonis 26406]EXK24191.1 hypothetical protein FOMG_19066 [Fusarium oxysporum f. sp. melonis 26406]
MHQVKPVRRDFIRFRCRWLTLFVVALETLSSTLPRLSTRMALASTISTSSSTLLSPRSTSTRAVPSPVPSVSTTCKAQASTAPILALDQPSPLVPAASKPSAKSSSPLVLSTLLSFSSSVASVPRRSLTLLRFLCWLIFLVLEPTCRIGMRIL